MQGLDVTVAATAPRYTAPPILEAVIQFEFSDSLSESSFRKLGKRLKRSYANELRSENVNIRVDFQNRKASFDAEPQLKLSSADEADIAALTRNTLTWSRLAPYEGWDNFRDRVMRDLEDGHSVTGFRQIKRVGVRYVNRIDVPKGEDNITRYEDYLAINIDLPDCWPTIDNYAWRFEKHFGDLHTIVQSIIVEPEVVGTAAFLLDIDVVAQQDVPAKSDDISKLLDRMRTLKNELFELSISDLARAQFKA